MKNKLRPMDLVNKWIFAFLIIFCGTIIISMYNGNENFYTIFYLFSWINLVKPPFGSEVSLLPVKREDFYRIHLVATKWIIGIFFLSILLMMIVGKAAYGADASYVNIIVANESVSSAIMLALCTSHLFRKIQIKNKLISLGIWMIISIAYMSVIGGIFILVGACIKNYIQVHFIFAILGGICSIVLFLFVDKIMYRVNIKLVKSYDFAAGFGAGGFNLSKEYKKQIKLKGE